MSKFISSDLRVIQRLLRETALNSARTLSFIFLSSLNKVDVISEKHSLITSTSEKRLIMFTQCPCNFQRCNICLLLYSLCFTENCLLSNKLTFQKINAFLPLGRLRRIFRVILRMSGLVMALNVVFFVHLYRFLAD